MEEALVPKKQKLFHNMSTMGALCQKRELKLLLIGRTGSGKSATGNAILGTRTFRSCSSTVSATLKVEVGMAESDNCIVTVVDCPGIGDTALDNIHDIEVACKNMEIAMKLSGNGFHALLLVVRFGCRFTGEDRETVEKLKAIFGKHIIRDFCIIVMTHGDNFEMYVVEESDTPVTFNIWLTQQTGHFQDLLQECNGRCILFNNRTSDPEVKKTQAKNLLSMVKDLLYRDIRYTPEHFTQAEEQRGKFVIEAKELRTIISEKLKK